MCNSAKWTDNDQNNIVKVHNNLRSLIARGVYVAKTGQKKPPAKDMQKISYDCFGSICSKMGRHLPDGAFPA